MSGEGTVSPHVANWVSAVAASEEQFGRGLTDAQAVKEDRQQQRHDLTRASRSPDFAAKKAAAIAAQQKREDYDNGIRGGSKKTKRRRRSLKRSRHRRR